MTRTRMVNVAGIAVALVLIASWALGAFWHDHQASGATSTRVASTPSATATRTGVPTADHAHLHRAGKRRTPSASPSATAAAPTAAATHHATAHHPTGAHHHSPSGTGGQGSTPSAHPTSSGGSPSPSPSGDVLTQILNGLTHLPH